MRASLFRTVLSVFILLNLLFVPAVSQPVSAAPLAAPAVSWCAAGTFNGWNDTSQPLYDDGTHGDLLPGDGVYSVALTLAAGDYEWKAVECGNWGNSFPTGENSWFTSDGTRSVVLTFDTNNHAGDAGWQLMPAQNILNALGGTLPTSFTVVGNFQGWNNANPATQMTPVGHGLFALQYTFTMDGTTEVKITETGGWSRQFTVNGRQKDGATKVINYTAGQTYIFLLDTSTGRWGAFLNATGSGNWCVAGDFNGWDNSSTPLYDDGTHGDLLGGDGIFSRTLTIATAGRYEWKAVSCGNWGISYPAQNAWLVTASDNADVLITFDTNDHASDVGAKLLPAQHIVHVYGDVLPATFNAVGSFQGWNNNDPAYTLTSLDYWAYGVFPLPKGSYIGKITTTASWDAFGADGRSKDAANVAFQVYANNDPVRFLLNTANGRMLIFAPVPQQASHDNDIWWNDLYHNSRDTFYRTPGGPVPTGTPVTLRFRAAKNDLTGVQVRVYNDRTNTQTLLNMTRITADDRYEYWEVILPASSVPTVYWYRFIAMDGTARAYYEDDATRDGGAGQTFATSPDNSWQVSVYDPAFQTPDWAKNAIIYQIFPDRFRDGNSANNKPAGTFFYNETGGTVFRSLDPEGDWNTPVCDPRAAGACQGTYSKNFYGGDLQGLIDQLDYLEDLGVTAIYLNPIFESPSNHGYDTTDFSKINPFLGDLTTFQMLVTEAHSRGIYIILDGVFNHTSSDSIYFDRYGRYSQVGACESPSSPYRDWYFFTDVTPGTGVCAGSDGTPNAATYRSWWGYDSLPILNSANPEVRAFIWDALTTDPIAKYWMQWADGWRLDVAGDIDQGTINSPDNDYWEGFRNAVHAVNPDAYIVGEEWGNATSWILGGEWDAVMNYQFSTAVLGFWRDEPFIDNDHNSASSAGIIQPLTPSQLDARLKNLAERYPPEALYAMMNLLGSHDTNRALFMLDHNTDQNDPALYQNPNYDWSDAIARLKGVTLLQMTLPGAPTIYYGDEIGLVGPVAHDGSTWQDDPYNRQPYPWLDETGTPFYTHLQSPTARQDLFNHYATLIDARKAYDALTVGDFRTLLTDDASGVYAFGRKSASSAAVVVLNRSTSPRSVSLDLSGYLPAGKQFTEIFTSASYTVSASGTLTLSDVPARGGLVLVATLSETAPAAVSDLHVTAEGDGTVSLAWSAVSGAGRYDIYRSLVSGGGYQKVGETTSTTYTDTGLANATRYYYVVVAVNTTTLLQSGYSNEAMGLPRLTIGWANLQWPPSITHTIGTTPTEYIYGQVYIDGVTSLPGPTPGLLAQVGYGPDGSDPATSTAWTWGDAEFNGNAGNNDEFRGRLLPEAVGTFDYAYRYSTDGGITWVYADLDGINNGYDPAQAGALTVNPSSDTEAPTAPVLSIVHWTPTSIHLSWTASTDNVAVYAYDIYRSLTSGGAGEKIARVLAPATTYVDTSVVAGTTYYYTVKALDTSFNASELSNEVGQKAEARMVEVTFNVTVPSFTVGTVYFTRVINPDGTVGDWNPAAVPMTQVDATHWRLVANLLDGQTVEFKFTRGSWDTVIKGANGNEELSNLSLTVIHDQTTGKQTFDYTVLNWRDPLITAFTPANASTHATAPAITWTWSQAINPADLKGMLERKVGANWVPVSGTVSYDSGTMTCTFTPAQPLPYNTQYRVTVSGQVDAGNDVQQVTYQWQFTIQPFVLYFPQIYRAP
ncbi:MULTISPECIES: alpha amylase N-terminal ig-like domain-containing protein [Anaerolinea]|uniref:alpha amylase N-terminal ig-like domain-containing protein n=1 Tax=Anaerolinea TaxID=233189 RepID=UPI002606DF95|nr:alpha amylase N-terminal ig-like domain-containing protein [Anaerolinea thermophila]